jgi:hypothetical protein
MESETDLATKPTKSKTRKNRATAKESQANTDVNVDPDDAAAPKKKKMRKLNVNLFAPSKPDSLDWVNQFNLVNRIAQAVGVLYRSNMLMPLFRVVAWTYQLSFRH